MERSSGVVNRLREILTVRVLDVVDEGCVVRPLDVLVCLERLKRNRVFAGVFAAPRDRAPQGSEGRVHLASFEGATLLAEESGRRSRRGRQEGVRGARADFLVGARCVEFVESALIRVAQIGGHKLFVRSGFIVVSLANSSARRRLTVEGRGDAAGWRKGLLSEDARE